MNNQNKAQNKILVIDDDSRIRMLLKMVLESREYDVLLAKDGKEGFDVFSENYPDLVILDIMMPVLDGLSCATNIRKISECPIIMLTAKGEEYDQIEGFEKGADDYVVKPFAPMVLIARVEALLKRTLKNDKNRKSYGILHIEQDAREVYVSDEKLLLSRKEYDLLVYLTENENISLSRDQILETVWGYDYLGSDNTVDTHINRLRNKLGKASDYIKTMRGFGYKFDTDN
jgi:two-component system, OmpR family, response regulator ResD